MSSPTTRNRARHGLTLLALSTLLASVVVLAPAASRAGSALPAGATTVTGTDGRVYIADSQGRARQFHGFNHKTSDPATLTDDLLAEGRERGMDHVRLAIYWDQFEKTEGVYDDAYFDRLLAALDRAQAHGYVVILDMHQDVYSQQFGGAGIPDWATRTDGLPFVPQSSWLLNYLQPAVHAAWEHLYEDADLRQAQIDAWTEVVNRVKGHPAVFGYDLLNEPFGKVRPGEDIVTAAARVESVQLTAMYQRLTDAISVIDPERWVFIEPPNLASLGVATSLGEVKGPKVALYPHMYDSDIEFATYNPQGVIELNPEFFDKWAGAITTYTARHPVPMLIGEWGVANPEVPGMDTFVERSLQTLDKVSSGWSVFNWCKGSGYCPIDAGGNDRPGIGQIFMPYARAIAGAPTASTWDVSSRTLHVQFDSNSVTAPTEIYLASSRAYPNGFVVETSDATGTWSQTYDAGTDVVAVSANTSPGSHAICVKPQGAPAGCVVAVAAPPAAIPVPGDPAFTG